MRRLIPQSLYRLRSSLRGLCRNLRGESGGALVEVALIVSLLGLPLLLGSTDMATVIYDSIEIENAAHSGAMYGMQGTCCILATQQMIAAAQSEAADFGSKLTVTPTSYYACSSSQASPTWTGTSQQIDSISLATAKSNCTGASGHVLAFVKVVASAPVPLPFHCCGLASSLTVTRASVMESEELP
jgi:Flp pilus assembly protein TadG